MLALKLNASKVLNYTTGSVATVLALWAATWALASALDRQAVVALYAAVGNERAARVADFAFAQLDLAVRLNPFNAGYAFHRGYFKAQSALSNNACGDDSSDGQAALANYRKALKHRPHWGDAWLDQAVYLWQCDGANLAALTAFDRALTYASVDYGVSRRSLPLGFAMWEVMQPPARQAFLGVVQLVLQHDPDLVLSQAMSASREALVQPLLDTPELIDRLERFSQ